MSFIGIYNAHFKKTGSKLKEIKAQIELGKARAHLIEENLYLKGKKMKKVLIVYYSLGGNTKEAAEAVAEGIRKGGAEPIMKMSLNANVEDFLNCDGLVVGSPDYFSYMAGGLKDFFDRTYYPTKGKVNGKPYVAFVTCGGGGKAIKSVEEMCQKFNLKKIAEPLIIQGKPDKRDNDKLNELGQNFASKL